MSRPGSKRASARAESRSGGRSGGRSEIGPNPATRGNPAVEPRAPFAFWADPTPRPGWLNMAIDSVLLERARDGECWFRLYGWEPCLSFGRHEPAARRYDAGRIATMGLAVVRRPTGGRAVWHARELTYAVAAPAAVLGPLRQAYLTIHTMLRDALRSLGAPAELAPGRGSTPVDAGACFATAAGGEVLVAARKVVGSAQVRQGSALLQHGSVLLEDDQEMVGVVSREAAATDNSIPLSRALRRPVRWEEVASAVQRTVSRAWGITPPRDGATSEVLRRARSEADWFRSDTWTWAGTR